MSQDQEPDNRDNLFLLLGLTIWIMSMIIYGVVMWDRSNP